MKKGNSVAPLVAIALVACLSSSSLADKISGTIVKEDGSPVTGADVRLIKRGKSWSTPPTRTISAADGSFTFDKLEPGDYRVWAFAGDLATRQKVFQGDIITAASDPQAPLVKLVAHPAPSLRVTVVTAADGKPVVGATVHLPLTDTDADFRTGDDGVAVIHGLTAEPWKIEAFAPNLAKVEKAINLLDASQVNLECALADGGSIAGKVVDSAGKPVAKVWVGVYPNTHGMWISDAHTDANGSYLVEHLPLDTPLQVDAFPEELPQKSAKATLTHAKRWLSIDLKLDPPPPTFTVSGTVLDADNAPIAGAQVRWKGGPRDLVRKATSDDAGKFTITGITPAGDREEQLVASKKGLAPVSLNFRLNKDGTPAAFVDTSKLVIKMTEPGHWIKGRVVDADGKPIKGARIQTSNFMGQDELGTSGTTDGDGRFAFDSLVDKSVFSFYMPGYSDMHWKKLKLDSGDNAVVMEESGAVEGTVVDADTSKPITTFNIRLRFSPRRDAQDESPSFDAELGTAGANFNSPTGAFRMPDLKVNAPLTFVVTAPGYAPEYVDNVRPTPGGKNSGIVVNLSKHPADAVTVAGRIIDHDGKPIANVEVRLITYAPTQRRELEGGMRFHWGMLKSGQLSYQESTRSIDAARTAADGSFRFANVRGGSMDLAYWGDRVPQTRVTNIEGMKPDEREKLELKIPALATLSGKINRKAFDPIDHLTLRSAADWHDEIELPLGKNQERYEFKNLPPGEYKLFIAGESIRDEGGSAFYYPWIARTIVEINEGQNKVADLGVGEMHSVSGALTTAGEPLKNGFVGLYVRNEPQEVRVITKTDEHGRFRFEHVSPGSYNVVPIGSNPPKPFLASHAEPISVDVDHEDIDRDFAFKNGLTGR